LFKNLIPAPPAIVNVKLNEMLLEGFCRHVAGVKFNVVVVQIAGYQEH